MEDKTTKRVGRICLWEPRLDYTWFYLNSSFLFVTTLIGLEPQQLTPQRDVASYQKVEEEEAVGEEEELTEEEKAIERQKQKEEEERLFLRCIEGRIENNRRINYDNNDTHFHDLPVEMIELIFLHADESAWTVGRFVCRLWKDVIDRLERERNDDVSLKGKRAQEYSLKFCALSAANGHASILRWARLNGCKWDSWCMAGAALGGHLDVMKWLRAAGCPWDEWTPTKAAEGGHLNVLRWLRGQGCPFNFMLVVSIASKEGHTQIVKWIKQITGYSI